MYVMQLINGWNMEHIKLHYMFILSPRGNVDCVEQVQNGAYLYVEWYVCLLCNICRINLKCRTLYSVA